MRTMHHKGAWLFKLKEMDKLQWYGYRHINGSIHVKRFFSIEDYKEAASSDFVEYMSSVFLADDRDEAIRIASDKLGVKADTGGKHV